LILNIYGLRGHCFEVFDRPLRGQTLFSTENYGRTAQPLSHQGSTATSSTAL